MNDFLLYLLYEKYVCANYYTLELYIYTHKLKTKIYANTAVTVITWLKGAIYTILMLPEQCLKLERQGSPHINKVKQNEVVQRVYLFGLSIKIRQ